MSRSPCRTSSGALTRPIRDSEFEPVADETADGYEGIAMLCGSGDAGEGGFEDHPRDLVACGQINGETGSEQLAPQHDPIRRDRLTAKEINSGLGIGV